MYSLSFVSVHALRQALPAALSRSAADRHATSSRLTVPAPVEGAVVLEVLNALDTLVVLEVFWLVGELVDAGNEVLACLNEVEDAAVAGGAGARNATDGRDTGGGAVTRGVGRS